MSDEEKGLGGDASRSLINQSAPQKREGGICAPWIWFKKKPWERKQFLVFLLFGLLTVVWLLIFFINEIGGYIVVIVAAFIMSGFGANHFRTLLALKVEVDKMSRLNKDFRAENVALKQEVDKLKRAGDQLKGVEAGFQESNRKLKKNIEKFKKLDKRLNDLAGANIEGLKKLQDMAQQQMQTMKTSLIEHEKAILSKIYDHLENNDKQSGLGKDEYDEFIKALPQSYQKRFKRDGLTFEKLSGNDPIIDYQEFVVLMDKFAEEEADAGGSQDD